MNRRRFPSESASRHQKEKQKPKEKQNLKQAACTIVMQLCVAGAGWQSRRASSRFGHLIMLQAGFWPTGQHNRPHHVTPALGESL